MVVLFRRRSRAVTKGIQPRDKTIITKLIGGGGDKSMHNAKKIHLNGPHSSQKAPDYRDFIHRRQSDSSFRGAHTTTASIRSDQKQSNGCAIGATESNGQKYADVNADVVKFVDSDDESDHDYGRMQRGNNKANIARYLLTFDEENIHLGDLPTMDLDKTIEIGRGFRLFLSQVHSPFKFWFQLNDNLEEIDSLMSRIK